MPARHPHTHLVKAGSQRELDLLFEDSESLETLLGPDKDNFSEMERKEYKKKLLRRQFSSPPAALRTRGVCT